MPLAQSRFKLFFRALLLAVLLCNTALAFTGTKNVESYQQPISDITRGLRDSAKILFDHLNKSGAWINTFNENTIAQFPIGIKKKIGGVDYQVGISAIYLGSNGGVARVFARTILPQVDAGGNKKELYFCGNVDLSRIGGVISDGKLPLIGNDSIGATGNWSLALKGNDPAKSDKSNQTYFKFDCAGFNEIGVIGEVLLSKDVFIPVSTSYQAFPDPNQICSAPINVVVSSFGSLLVNKLKFSKPFMMKKTKDYAFQIDEAMLDFSDTKNPEGTDEGFAKYLEEVQPDEPNTWQGLVITKMQVFLPREFKMKDSKDRVGFTAPYGVIDATGFSTVINQKNILPLEKGRAGTWGFSVDEIGVYVKYNELNGGSLGGKLVLPIQSKKGKDGLSYFGKITKDGEYEITVGSIKDIKASFWKAKLEIDKSSSVTLKVKDGEFLPKVNLSGKISFNMDGDKAEEVDEDAASSTKKKKSFKATGIIFEELELQTVKPYFQVKAMGVEGKLHIASFEAEYSVTVGTDIKQDVSGPKIKTRETKNVNNGTTNSAGTERASLNIALDIKLMNGKIGGKTKLAINALYNDTDGEWQFDNVELGMIGISGDFGKAKFDGELAILKNDEVYGNAFSGKLKLKVNKFELKALGIFGVKDDFRYWSVDGMAKGFKIQAGPITFTGFSGGVSYKMDLADKESPKLPSGILYVPSNNAFLRVRAGVLFDIMTAELMTASAGFEIVFNSNWGVNSMSINGTLRMLAGDDNKGEARMKGNMRKFSNPKAEGPKEDASVWGDIFIKFDIENGVYSGVMNAYVNFADYIIGAQSGYKAGQSSFYASDEKWHIYVGTDRTPVSLKLNGPIGITGTGYFMMGNDIKSPYGSGNFGLKHGMSASISLSAHWGWIWAEFGGGLKYDVLLMHTQNFTCGGSPAGLNGWFGEGRVSAGMYGAVGMHFHMSMPWFIPDINIDREVFRASINASLFLSGPKPFYASGHLDGRYSVWIFHGSFGVDFSKGTRCSPPPPPPYKLNPADQAVEDAMRARRDTVISRMNDMVKLEWSETSKNYLKKINTLYFDAKTWTTPIDLAKNEKLIGQATDYLNQFNNFKASESSLISKRDELLGRYNLEVTAEKVDARKTMLKSQVVLLTEEKSWSTPINKQTSDKIIHVEDSILNKFKADKIAEASLIERRNGLIAFLNPYQKTFLEKDPKQKQILVDQFNLISDDKKWSVPLANFAASQKIIESVEKVVAKYKTDKAATDKENEQRLNKIENDKKTLSDLSLKIPELLKKRDQEKNAKKKVVLNQQFIGASVEAKKLASEIKRDEVLVGLYKNLDEANTASAINLIYDKINKLKTSTAENMDANISSVEKTISAEKEAKRKEEEKIAAEKKELEDLQNRKTFALNDLPNKISGQNNKTIKAQLNKLLVALQKANTKTEILNAINDINKSSSKIKY